MNSAHQPRYFYAVTNAILRNDCIKKILCPLRAVQNSIMIFHLDLHSEMF